MKINVHAGHAAIGKGAIGAVGLLNESVEDRRVKDEVIRLLRLLGHTVYDCTVDSGTAAQVLSGIVAKCNAHTVDLDVSIHFNAGANDKTGNGKTTGAEVYIYSDSSTFAKGKAQAIVNEITTLGFKNRGVKVNPSLYVLKNTKAQALLIECCFVDDKDDAQIYDAAKMAAAIVYGITGQRYSEPAAKVDSAAAAAGSGTATGDASAIYRVQVGAYRSEANAKALQAKLKAAGFDAFIAKA